MPGSGSQSSKPTSNLWDFSELLAPVKCCATFIFKISCVWHTLYIPAKCDGLSFSTPSEDCICAWWGCKLWFSEPNCFRPPPTPNIAEQNGRIITACLVRGSAFCCCRLVPATPSSRPAGLTRALARNNNSPDPALVARARLTTSFWWPWIRSWTVSQMRSNFRHHYLHNICSYSGFFCIYK